MANYIYECPVCNNLIMLAIDSESCPFQRSLVGQCDKCNNKVEIYQDSYEVWLKEKEKEVKSDGS